MGGLVEKGVCERDLVGTIASIGGLVWRRWWWWWWLVTLGAR